MGHFRRWINDLALKEIHVHGHKFTWSNGQNNPTLVKLDRALCSIDWEYLFPDAIAPSWMFVLPGPCPLLSLSAKLKATARGLQS
jgi:hypothetical protein